MQYRVEELAGAAGIRVDTIRFYQRRGLLAPPRREGRLAWYGPEHLDRLRRIRELGDDGFTLRQIGRLLEASDPAAKRLHAKEAEATADQPLLAALVEERVGARTHTRREVAELAGVPEALVVAAETAGLIVPIEIDGEARYGDADVEMGRAALALLGAGFPMDELFALAVQHARNVTELADAGIDLFGAHALEASGRGEDDAPPAEALAALFRDLLPEVTRLVAIHFQRTLVRRALERLGEGGAGASLQEALERAATARLEVAWR
jgi:DNA-binding transcriptional MerR regulator